MIGFHGFGSDQGTIHQQQIRPFVSPVVDKFRSVQQMIDQLVSFILTLIRNKSLNFFRGGQCADLIDIRAADEVGIIRLGGRGQVQAF